MPLSLKDIRPEPRFRPAIMDDAALLYAWRLAAEQAEWWQGAPVSFREHSAWLRARIDNPLVKVLIWEVDGQPTGTVRIDSGGELALHGGDQAMLEAACAYASEYGGRLKATVDEADTETVVRLLRAGFDVYPVTFMAYRSRTG